MKTFPAHLSTLSAVTLALCACSGASSVTSGSGGSAAGGGATEQGGTAGASAGGANAGGVATGGAPSTGGAAATGGLVATGGSKGAGGGVATTGGSKASGGAISTGGSRSSGGSTASGGVSSTGGSKLTGGAAAVTGGSKATGGSTATGGSKATGGASSANTCSVSGALSSSSGELTCYYFGQGTSQADQTCPNAKYKTACGYCGNEAVSGTAQACSTSVTDTVQNITTGANFAAIAQPYWNAGQYCGMCVNISYGGKSVVVTIVDECASCPTNGHLDLSPAAANALGLTTQIGDVTTGVTWTEVACPTPGNIVALCNGSCGQQFYFQGGTYPIVSATAGGHTAHLNTAFWDFGANVVGQTVTLTDAAGNVITGTIPSSNGGTIGAAPKCN